MQYTVISDYRLGVDARRSSLSSPPGTLAALVNGHITAGGEAEKRGRFVGLNLPSNSYGLQSTAAGLMVFGSVAEGSLNATLPDGVTYQQLVHPDGAAVMVGVIHSAVRNGLPFVIADFGADGTVSYYDGEVVDDLSPGKLATILADADALAEYIAGLVNGTEDYTAVDNGDGTVTITGPAGEPFQVEVSNESSCTSAIPVPDVDGIAITSMVLTITGMTYSEAFWVLSAYHGDTVTGSHTGKTNHIFTHDPESGWTGTPVTGPWALELDLLALYGSAITGGGELEVVITAPDASHTGEVTLSIEYANGATQSETWNLEDYFGVTRYFPLVADTPASPTITATQTVSAFNGFDGTAPRAQFEVIAVDDTSAAGTNQCVQVTVDKGGVDETDLITTPVEVASSVEAMAQAIATEINSTAAGFTATASGALVLIAADADFEDWNGKSLTVDCQGAVVIGRAKIGIAKLAGSATIPTITDIKVGDVSIIDTGGGNVTGSSVTELCTNLAYRINTDTDPHGTEFVAAAVGEAVYLSKRFTASGDADLTITVSITDGTTTADSAGSPMRVTASPTEVGYGSSWSAGKRTQYVAVTVAGGRAPYYYRWEQITTTAMMVHFPNAYRTDFTAYASDLATGRIVAQWKCVVTDSDGAVAESAPVQATLA